MVVMHRPMSGPSDTASRRAPRRHPRWRQAAGLALAGTLLILVTLARPQVRGAGSSAQMVPPVVEIPGTDPVLIGAGDIAECGVHQNDEATARLLDAAVEGSGGPVVVFDAGDSAYPDGSPGDYARCFNTSWGRHKARILPAAGNHDYRSPGALPYFTYFGAAAGNPAQGYYSYNLGTWHIVVLNSNCKEVGGCGAGSAQEKWLRADLAASAASCTLAYWHHPRFSNGGHHNDASYQPFWRALYDYGAEIVLAGHDHNYQRYAPLTPGGQPDEVRGIREFVVGTGGTEIYALRPPTSVTEAQSDTGFGVLKMTLHAGSYDWEFLPVSAGGFTDKGSGTCH